MQVGLFFGSFNPIHNGHIQIASYFLQATDITEIWFVVSPQNPFKTNNTDLLDENTRLHLIELTIKNNTSFKTCKIEFDLPRPSYTVDTLKILRENFPDYTFIPIIGGDNLHAFHHWKNYEEILSMHDIYVYKREGFKSNSLLKNNNKIKEFDVPLLNISSTQIRNHIKSKEPIDTLVPQAVEQYIKVHNLYR